LQAEYCGAGDWLMTLLPVRRPLRGVRRRMGMTEVRVRVVNLIVRRWGCGSTRSSADCIRCG